MLALKVHVYTVLNEAAPKECLGAKIPQHSRVNEHGSFVKIGVFLSVGSRANVMDQRLICTRDANLIRHGCRYGYEGFALTGHLSYIERNVLRVVRSGVSNLNMVSARSPRIQHLNYCDVTIFR